VIWRSAFAIAAMGILSACEQNTFVPPPPPKVDVAVPVQGSFTRYLEATGNTAPVKSVDLVARVQGFLQTIEYKDGASVKEGAPLFTIEPETYKLKLEQAQAAETGAQATLKQAEADFKRQSDLVARQAVSQATLDTSTSTRDNAQANLQQAQANTRIAQVNYGYTKVTAPFDGIVTAHMVSVGELVGVTSPTQLATIVQIDPIWMTFNMSEQDVLRIRANMAKRKLTLRDIDKVPCEVGLMIEEGFPHMGHLDYAAPEVDPSSGTLMVRCIFENKDRALIPGLFARVRVPLLGQTGAALLVPDAALGTSQLGRYLLVVNKDNSIEQRVVEVGQLFGDLREITKGLTADDRVVINDTQRAIPGRKVDPQEAKIPPPPAASTKP